MMLDVDALGSRASDSSDEQPPDPTLMLGPRTPSSATSFVHDLVAACRRHVTVPEPSDASFTDIRQTAESLEEVRAANGTAATAAASPHRSEGATTAAAASELMRREADVATLGRQLRRLMVYELRHAGCVSPASERSLCNLVCAAAIEQEDVDASCGDYNPDGGWLREVTLALGSDTQLSAADMYDRLRMARGETAVPLTAATRRPTPVTAPARPVVPIAALADFSDDTDSDADDRPAAVRAQQQLPQQRQQDSDDDNGDDDDDGGKQQPTLAELVERPYHYIANTHELARERVWVAADFEAEAGDCIIFSPADGQRGSEEIAVVASVGRPTSQQQPVAGLRPATAEDLVTYERVNEDAAELRRIAEDTLADAQVGGIDIVAATLQHDRSRVVFYFTDSVDLRPSYDELHAVGSALGEELQVTVVFVNANAAGGGASGTGGGGGGAGASRNALLTPQERKQLSLARKKATRMAAAEKHKDAEKRQKQEEEELTAANGWDPALAPFVAAPFAENATGILDEHADFLVQTFSGSADAEASSTRIRARLRLWFEGVFTGRSSAELLPGVAWAKAKVWAFECPFEHLDPENELHHDQAAAAAAANDDDGQAAAEPELLVPMSAVHPELPDTWHIGSVLLTTLHAYLPEAPADATTDGYVFRVLATDLAGKALFISEDESPTIEDAFEQFLSKAPEAITSEAATPLFFGSSELAGVHARVVALPPLPDEGGAEDAVDESADDGQRGIVDALLWPCQDLKAHLLQGFRAVEVPPTDSPGAQVRTRLLRSLTVLLTQLRHAFPDTVNSEVAARAAASVPAIFAPTAAPAAAPQDGKAAPGKDAVKRLPIHHSYFAKNKYRESVCGITASQAAYLLDDSKWAPHVSAKNKPHPRARLRLWFESLFTGKSAEELLPETRYNVKERRWALECPINADLDPLSRFTEDPSSVLEQTVTQRYADLPDDWNVTTVLLGVLKITFQDDQAALTRYRMVATDLNGAAVFVTTTEASSVAACYAEFLAMAPEALTEPTASPVFVATEELDDIDERLLTPSSMGLDTKDQCAVVARILGPCRTLVGTMARFRGLTHPPSDSPGPAARAAATRALATLLSDLQQRFPPVGS